VKGLLTGIVLLFVSVAVNAQDLYMVRSQLAFPEAMAVLQETIREHGLTVSRVQRVDIGLTAFGYKTDKYRIVFYGELEDFHEVTNQYPELVAYLPLKIAIFAEGDETLLLASSFEHLRVIYSSASMQSRFDRWEENLRSILEEVRISD
jgi:uncharacterized protein (DUF302 family)